MRAGIHIHTACSTRRIVDGVGLSTWCVVHTIIAELRHTYAFSSSRASCASLLRVALPVWAAFRALTLNLINDCRRDKQMSEATSLSVERIVAARSTILNVPQQLSGKLGRVSPCAGPAELGMCGAMTCTEAGRS